MWQGALWVMGGIAGFLACGRASVPVRPSESSASTAPEVLRGAYVTYSGRNRVLTVGNGFFSRTLSVDPLTAGVVTVRLRTRDGRDLLRGPTEEFRLRVGEKDLLGFGGDLVYDAYETSGDPSGVRRVRITLKSAKPPLKLLLGFDVFPDAPLMRKSLEVVNLSGVPLRIGGAIVERLSLSAPARVVGWERKDTLRPWSLPASAAEEGGLFWLQWANNAMGFLNEAPGPLKRAEVNLDGDLLVGTNEITSEFWIQSGETVAFPAVWTYFAEDGDTLKGSTAFLTALRKLRRTLAREESLSFFVAETNEITPRDLERLPVGGVVCLNYAWQNDLDASSPPETLFRVATTIRNSGRLLGLRVPLAWLPPEWHNRHGPDWVQTDPDGNPIPAMWDGMAGVQASLASDYAIVASQSLIAIVQRLAPDYLLLDGALRQGDATAFGYGSKPRRRASDWTLWMRALWTLNLLAQERPQMGIGVSSGLYGMSRGFDMPLWSVGFLWSWKATPSPNEAFWRVAQSVPYPP